MIKCSYNIKLKLILKVLNLQWFLKITKHVTIVKKNKKNSQNKNDFQTVKILEAAFIN